MEPVVAAAVSAFISIAVALSGAWVARRKGLPAINAEIETRNSELIRLLQATVADLQDRLALIGSDYAACKARMTQTLAENKDLRERVTLAEGDLVKLQRERRTPPRRV